MARWGDEKTLHFICLYRQRECLWNTRSPLYKNKVARYCAYKSMLEEFNDPLLDMKTVKTKIKNLRSVYHTELKKLKYMQAQVGSEAAAYKPSLAWFQEMHAFLGDSVDDRQEWAAQPAEASACTDTDEVEARRRSTDNDSTSNQDNTIEHITIQATLEPNLDPLQNAQLEHQTFPEFLDTKTRTITLTPYSSLSSVQQPARPINRRVLRRSRLPGNNNLLNALKRLENRVYGAMNTCRQPPPAHTHHEDEFHLFALNVAAQLRQLPLHIAIATQTKIQNTLSEARLASIFANTPDSPTPTLAVKTEDMSKS